MLIVCPSCATSYMIDPASVGGAGRTVRCARCKNTWFAGPGPANPVSSFVDNVIAEAEADAKPPVPPPPPPPPPTATETAPQPRLPAVDDFGIEPASPRATSLPSWTPGAIDAGSPPAISDAPPLAPAVEHDAHTDGGRTSHDGGDIETFAARRRRLQGKRGKMRRSSRWTAIILVLFAFNVALVGARHEVVRYLPQTASLFSAVGLPVNLRNLTFDKVRITREIEDGNAILVVQGQIVSASNKAAEVPRLRFAARNAAGQEIYVWTAKPDRSVLGAGESMKFTSRLATPPADAHDVMVRFFTAQDAMAGGAK